MRRFIISTEDIKPVSGDARAIEEGNHGGTSYRVINQNTVGSESLRISVQEFPEGGYTEGHPVHYDREQCFYILNGTMHINIDGTELVAPSGSYVYLPRGCEHNYRNLGPDPLRFMTINCPVQSGEVAPIPVRKD